MERIFLRLREFAIEFPDGTILGIGNLEPIKRGWVVRIKGQTGFQGLNGMIAAIQLASKTTEAIAGTRVGGENEMWDVVAVFQSEVKAMKEAKVNENDFIYQIETGTLKRVE